MHGIPSHVGIIPDGNRRWAEARGLGKEQGYAYGLTAGLDLLRAAKDRGIKELTYYGFTVDNCKRPRAQVEAFTDACCEAIKLAESENVSVRVVGNTDSSCFPAALLPYARNSDAGGKFRVNFLVNYGWEWDMRSSWASRDIPRIDLVIRWGGMCRLSGFLPLQTVYADLCVLPDLWPDFCSSHLDRALEWYSRQDVTLGG